MFGGTVEGNKGYVWVGFGMCVCGKLAWGFVQKAEQHCIKDREPKWDEKKLNWSKYGLFLLIITSLL